MNFTRELHWGRRATRAAGAHEFSQEGSPYDESGAMDDRAQGEGSYSRVQTVIQSVPAPAYSESASKLNCSNFE